MITDYSERALSGQVAPNGSRILISALLMLAVLPGYSGTFQDRDLARDVSGRPQQTQQALSPIQFANISWDSSKVAVRRQLESDGYEFVYHHEDNTLMYGGPYGPVRASVFAYFTTADELVRFNILIDEDSEVANVELFLTLREEFTAQYADYDRIYSPLERDLQTPDNLSAEFLTKQAQTSQARVWSAWRHVSATGDTTMAEIRLLKLSEKPPWPNRLVVRVWYYSPRWFREERSGRVTTWKPT